MKWCEQMVKARFEFWFGNFFRFAKVVVLDGGRGISLVLNMTFFWEKEKSGCVPTHISKIRNKSPVSILFSFFDDPMSALFFLVSLFVPFEDTISHFCDHSVVTFPSFEIYCKPCSSLCWDEVLNTLEYMTTQEESWISALQAFVMFVQVLKSAKSMKAVW